MGINFCIATIIYTCLCMFNRYLILKLNAMRMIYQSICLAQDFVCLENRVSFCWPPWTNDTYKPKAENIMTYCHLNFSAKLFFFLTYNIGVKLTTAPCPSFVHPSYFCLGSKKPEEESSPSQNIQLNHPPNSYNYHQTPVQKFHRILAITRRNST